MKYEVITDLQGYVQVLRHTGTRRDFVELDLEKYDLTEDRMYAYKLGKNELIFDEKRYQEILDVKQHKADLKEIADLKEKLNGTDWIMAKWVEEILALNNPLTWVADVVKINIKYMKEYSKTIADRKAWRKRIEELEND
jgi:hypothetical protein